jgi:hypothetical protein
MLESKNGVCGMENQNQRTVLNYAWHVEVLPISEKNFVSCESESKNSVIVKSDMILVA